MSETATTRQTGKILVVDDTSANLKLLSNLLTEYGHTVYPASDGELALEFVRTTLPDLILLDIRMPGLDGFEVCRRLQADQRVHNVPVIFISILENEQDKVDGFKAGAVDYITKPFQSEEVLARVDIHLRLKQLTERLRHRTAELETRNEEMRQSEKTLIREREFSRALLESMADGVVACDAQGALALFNRAAREWHGVDPVKVPQEKWASQYDLFRADGVTPLSTEEIPLVMAFQGKEIRDAGMAIVARDQPPRFIRANGSMIKDPDGKKLGAVVIMRDITDFRRLEQDLRQANDELEKRISELAVKNDELEKVNQLFVGRELKMVELKKQIEKLEKQIKGT